MAPFSGHAVIIFFGIVDTDITILLLVVKTASHMYITLNFRPESRGFRIKVALDLSYLHIKFDDEITKHTADKLWVTQQFKDVIRQRQRALLSGNRQEYSRLRNRAGRMSKSLRQKYYQKKVQALHEADSHSW